MKGYIAQTKRTYSRIATQYHAEGRKYAKWYSDTLAPFERLLKKKFENPSILDIGCGAALELELLHKHGFSSLYGMDISPQMLRIARKSIPSGKFYEGNILTRRLDRKFDAIMMISLMHLLKKEDIPRALGNVRAMLADNGYFLQTVFNRRKPRMGFINKSGYGRSDVVRYVREYTMKESVQELSRNGFTVLKSYSAKYKDRNREGEKTTGWLLLIAKKD